MRPLEAYRVELERDGFLEDPAQLAVVQVLDELYRELQPQKSSPIGALLARLRSVTPAPVRGLYLWGGVGRGKTFLMDLFYGCLPAHMRRRSHFHRFMLEVHDRLHELRQQSDPLPQIARDIAKDTRVLCFDELFVSDIADAMLLGGLFTALFDQGVTLIATSNSPPSGLYADGLQRARFLPAIAALEANCRVMHLDHGIDYRLRVLERAEIYHSPLDAVADRNLESYFDDIAPDPGKRSFALMIEHRPIMTRRVADGVIWCDFDSLCDGPRGTADYIEVAREFHTVMLSGVPQLTGILEDQARRFIALVDELYERNVTLILSAAVPLDSLYAGKRLGFEFQRTRSRLQEMQSHEYLARAHLP